MTWKRNISEYMGLIIGSFLIIDSLFLHTLTFNYARFGLQALDPYISHWMIGLVLVVAAIIGLNEK